MQKFDSSEHLGELCRLPRYLEEHPDCPIITGRRQFTYLVNEAKDPAFLKCNAAIQLNGKWFIWPQGLANYVENQIEITLRRHAA